MAVINPNLVGGTNITAFLDMIASKASEGTASSPVTANDGYDVIVSGINGHNIFTDYSQHPFASGRAPVVVNHAGLTSTASGRYQFLVKDWLAYKALLSLPDFSPLSQDKWAIRLIKECNAIPAILAGDLDTAIGLCAHIWASLPGNSYGQPESTDAALEAADTAAGGVIGAPAAESVPEPMPVPAATPEGTLAAVEAPVPAPSLVQDVVSFIERI